MHKANAQKEGIEGSRSCQKVHKSCKKTCKNRKQIVAVIVLYLIIVQLVVPQIVVLIVPLIVVVRIVILSTFIVILSTFIVVAHSLLPTTCNRTCSSSVVFFLASASLPNLCLQGCRLLSASPSPFPFLLLHSLSPEAKKQPEKRSRIANKRPQFVSLKKWDRKNFGWQKHLEKLQRKTLMGASKRQECVSLAKTANLKKMSKRLKLIP